MAQRGKRPSAKRSSESRRRPTQSQNSYTTGSESAVGGDYQEEAAAGKTLTVHIGVNKTGSSAIQDFLGRNSHRLRERGIIFPDENLRNTPDAAGQHVWYFERSKAHSNKRAAALATTVEALFGTPGVRQVIISAENLSNQDSSAYRLFKDIVKRYETEVVVYLRRQDDFLLSSWQQWYAKIEADFWAWLTSCVGVIGDWRAVLRRWESIVGRERIHVRLYERDELLGGDAVTDFIQFLQLDGEVEELAAPRSKIVNPSFNQTVASLVPGSGLFEDGHDDEFYRFLEETLGPDCYKRTEETAITYEQRMAILQRYEDGNAWIRERYFAGSDVPPGLFTLPTPHDYRVLSEPELTRRQIQMLLRLVFEVRRRQGPLTETR